ncbi:MAG TPA: DmsE family decaheme c-type cytochrome [Bryobacteraceae bacterium]|nr:DmsE family decaheme c-type cytochrome [Bryobacteraceae bacterium]
MSRLLLRANARHAKPPTRRFLRAARVAAGALLLLGVAAAQETAGASSLPAGSAGSQACQVCHEDIFKAFQKNPHQLVETDKKRGWENRACESCHGPGGKHAESVSAADIRQPAKLPAAEADRICLTCHQNQPTHAGRINSSHAKNEVSCVSCHSIHKNGPNGLVARGAPAINAQCAGCHTDVWSSFQRPYKHRLPEGAMSCVDCHNPHGGPLPKGMQMARANEPGCFNCHGDKAGPFVFEHAPVRLEGCSACHEPHGSANPRMLTRAQVQFVCLECHANLPGTPTGGNPALGKVPPSFHDLRSARFNNCTVCHQKVHGSWVDRELLK